MTANLRLTPPDYLVIAGYFVIVLWVGLYFRNRMEGAKDFFAGGNRVPWWLAGISHYMSSFSAFAFIAYAQMAYTWGWVAVTLFWVTVPACAAGGLVFASRWRRARVITPVEFLETRFNAFVRQLFAWAGIPVKVFDDALKIFATSLFLSVSTGANIYFTIVLCGAVTVAYSFFGGLWALLVTDYVQFLMKALAMALLLPLAIHAAGGAGAAFSGLPPGFLRMGGGPFGWTYIAGFAVLMMISYNANWSLAQKYYSVRDEREAARVAYCAGALNLVGAPLMILPAVIGRKLLPDLIATNRTADAYVLLILTLLPVGMIGIMVAAMFSATMAMVSADFNSVASVLTRDVYQRFIRPEATERGLVSVGRAVTLLLGALTTALAVVVALTRMESLFNMMVTVLGLFLAPTLLPLVTGLLVRRLTWRGAFAGFAFGLATGFAMLALKTWWVRPGYTFDGVSLLANTGATLLGMLLGTALFGRTAAEKEKSARFFASLDRPVGAEEVPAGGAGFASPVLGASTVGVGILLAAAGLLSGSDIARKIDLTVGVILMAGGLAMKKRAVRTRRGASAAAGVLLLAASGPVIAAETGGRIAAFRADATPAMGEPLIWVTPTIKVEDPLWAKGVIIEEQGARYVMCAVDWCGIGGATYAQMRRPMAEAARTDVSRVALHSVHHHTAPYIDGDAYALMAKLPATPLLMSAGYLDALGSRIEAAVRDAAAKLQPFDRVGTGTAEVERVASARRIHHEGKLLTRYSTSGKDPMMAALPEGAVDSTLRTVSFAKGAKVLARLHYYATHPQTFCCDGRVSGDFLNAAREAVEQREKVPQIYFTGCSGDVTVGKYNDGSDAAREGLAERMRAAMEKSIASTRFSAAPEVRWRTAPLALPKREDAQLAQQRATLAAPAGKTDIELYRAAIGVTFHDRREPITASVLEAGNIRVLHLPGEPMLVFQRFAQQQRPRDFVAVAGYGDISPGYLCTDEAHAEGGYEPSASNAAPGTAEALKKVITELLAR